MSSKRIYQLMSLLIALSLWLYVVAGDNIFQERTMTVDVKYENLEESLIPSAKMPTVNVRIKGDQSFINSVRPADFTVTVDLEDASVGEEEYKVSVLPPAGIRVDSVSPPKVFIELEKMAEKQVPVRANITGTVKEGFTSFEPIIKTSHVTVKGPATMVNYIEFVTAEVNLDNADMSLSLKLMPQISEINPIIDNELLVVSPDIIDIFVPVIENKPSKSVPVRVPVVGVPSYGHSVKRVVVEPEIIRISGTSESLDRIQEIQTQAVDLTNASENISIEVPLIIPPDITSTYEDTIRVTVIFEKNIIEKRIEKELEIRNIPEGLELTSDRQKVGIVLRGEEVNFRDFTIDSLQVYVDAGIYSEDKNVFVVQVSQPPKLEIIDINPGTVTLSSSE